MPRRADHHLAYWNVESSTLRGYPRDMQTEGESSTPLPDALEAAGDARTSSLDEAPDEVQEFLSPYPLTSSRSESSGPELEVQVLLGAPPNVVSISPTASVDPSLGGYAIDTRDLSLGKAFLSDDSRSPVAATIVMRDRLGFRYERRVGLRDYIGESDAAQLLGVPVMRVNRLVRAGKLRARKRRYGGEAKGASARTYSVVQVGEVLRLAKTLKLAVPLGKALTVVGTGEKTRERTRPQKEK